MVRFGVGDHTVHHVVIDPSSLRPSKFCPFWYVVCCCFCAFYGAQEAITCPQAHLRAKAACGPMQPFLGCKIYALSNRDTLAFSLSLSCLPFSNQENCFSKLGKIPPLWFWSDNFCAPNPLLSLGLRLLYLNTR